MLSIPRHRAVPTNPAEVFRRVSPYDAPSCLRPKSEGSDFGVQYFRGHMGSLALRPGGSLTIHEMAFVNRLQDSQFPSFLLFKLRGFELLPRWDFHPVFMPAFAGRTLLVPNPSNFLERLEPHSEWATIHSD